VRTAIATLACLTAHAAAGDLYGITASGRFVSIDTETGQATTLFETAAPGGTMAYAPDAGVFAVISNDNEPGSLIRIDLDGTVENAGSIKGLPPGQEKTGSVGFSGSGDLLFVTFGQTGTVFETRIAELGLDAVVTRVSPDLGMGDNDGVVWDAFNNRTLVHDYNANDGLPRVAEVFSIFTAPYYIGVGQLPSRGDVGDSAVDPDSGRLFVTGFDAAGGFLVEVLETSYDEIGPFNAGEQVVGIAFGPSASCNPADIALPRDVLDLADIAAFIAGFLSGAPAYDFDGNGVYDLDDITVFVDLFLAGCP